MNKLGIIIDLPADIRELYVSYDFEYFLNKVVSDSKDFKDAKVKYTEIIKELKAELKENKKQTLFHIDGAVRKMHSGGLLPSLFELDETRKLTGLDFSEYGLNWAYFDLWKKYEKRKILKTKISKMLLFWGAILAYALTVIKIIEYLKD
jgi:hypothetical protein